MFIPGVSTVVGVTSGGGAVTVPLTGADPNTGVIRVHVGATTTSGVYLDFTPTGLGVGMGLTPGDTEFFKIPAGATNVYIQGGGSSGATVSVTIGQED